MRQRSPAIHVSTWLGRPPSLLAGAGRVRPSADQRRNYALGTTGGASGGRLARRPETLVCMTPPGPGSARPRVRPELVSTTSVAIRAARTATATVAGGHAGRRAGRPPRVEVLRRATARGHRANPLQDLVEATVAPGVREALRAPGATRRQSTPRPVATPLGAAGRRRWTC